MAILINKNTRMIVQGITGKQGSFHTKLMKEYGTNIVAGVTPGKTGQEMEGIPVYDSVKDALTSHEAEWSSIFVPARFAKDAAIEAMKHGLNAVLITENIPVHDSIEIMRFAKKNGRIVIGPNCPGIITPGEAKIGIMPGHIFREGKVGVVSRSGTLTYEIVNALSDNDIGQSTVIGIGGDPVIGFDFLTALEMFQNDENTEKILLLGEIGGDMEERAAKYIKGNVSKQVIAYIAGRTAPKGKKMGHAGAVISGNTGTAESKVKAFNEVGVKVAEIPSQIIELLSI